MCPEAHNPGTQNNEILAESRFEVVVPNALAQERLDRLVALIWECSRAEAARLVAEGKVVLNGMANTARSQRVAVGDVVKLAELPVVVQLAPQPDESVRLDLLYEDEHLVVVNKPAHLVVHPGSGNSTGTMVNGLLAMFPEMANVGELQRPGIVHRLDRGTSGVLLVARTLMAYEALIAALAKREVERRYFALVAGLPGDSRGVIDAPVGRSSRHPTKMAVVADGRAARTHYEVLARMPVARRPQGGTVRRSIHHDAELAWAPNVDAAHLELKLETGRTHQIRVHLATIGYPLLGDELYGGPVVPILGRPALHAHTLQFAHPVTGERLGFCAAPPQDFTALLDALTP